MDPQSLFHKRLSQYQFLFPNIREYISQNPHLTMSMVLQDIKQHPQVKHQWQFDHLCHTIPVDTLLANDFIPERPDLISSYLVNLTIDTLKRTKDTIPWGWSILPRHKDIKIADIANHPDLPWILTTGFGIAYNPNLTHQDILDYPHLFTNQYLNMSYMNISRTVTFEEIQKHPNKPWTYHILANLNVKTIEQVQYLLNTYFQGINYNENSIKMHTCMNPNLTFPDLLQLFGPDIVSYAVYNPNVTLEQLQQFPEEKWKKQLPHMGHRVPIDYILQHSDIEWDWTEIMRSHKDLPYDTFIKVIPALEQAIKRNANFTVNEYRLKRCYFNNLHLSHLDRKRLYEDLLKYVTQDNAKLPYDYLIKSPLFLEPTFQEIKEHFAKKKIIRHIVETHSNPAYHQCRNRLKRELQQLSK